MADCYKCWWADFAPNAPDRHAIYEEPDYLQMKTPHDTPPMVRTIKTCGQAQTYFRLSPKSNTCPKFVAYETEQLKDEQRIKETAKRWKGKTSRERLPPTKNMFAMLTVMYENDNAAYEILVDAMGMDPAKAVDLFLNLDDMNIRGTQIVKAMEYVKKLDGRFGLNKLIDLAEARSERMIKYINSQCDPKTEEAVQLGARLYGHAKPSPKKLEDQRKMRVAILDDQGGKRVRHHIKLPPRRK